MATINILWIVQLLQQNVKSTVVFKSMVTVQTFWHFQVSDSTVQYSVYMLGCEVAEIAINPPREFVFEQRRLHIWY
jgi:hypothetical protein